MDDAQGRYELLDRIGAGGMAEVFRARMVGAAGFEKPVAIKRILADFVNDDEFVSRFIDEARLTARLVHPNICQIVDFGVMGGRHFIAMEFVDGLDLSRVLGELDTEDERMPLDVSLFVMASVLRGLKFAHEAVDEEGRPLGIIHRDVSPANVLLSVNGDVKLGDLGAATANPDQRSARTQKHFRLGKVLYMAPEQRSRSKVDIRADLYSTGVLITEMLLGQEKFQRIANMYLAGMCTLPDQVVEAMGPETGPQLAGLVARATEKDPNRRFDTAAEMLGAVDALFAELAPGTSVDRVARLVARLKARSLARKPLVSSADSSAGDMSLSGGDLISLVPDAEDVDGLDDAPTVGRGSSSDVGPLPPSEEAPRSDVTPPSEAGPSVNVDHGFPEAPEPATVNEELPTTARYREAPQLIVGRELGDGGPPRREGLESRVSVSRALPIAVLGLALAAGLGVGAYLAQDRLGAGQIRYRPRPRAASVAPRPELPGSALPDAASAPDGSSASLLGTEPPPLPLAQMALAVGGFGDGGPTPDAEAEPAASSSPDTGTKMARPRDRSPPRERPPPEKSSAKRAVGFLNINSRPFGVPYVDGVRVGSETPVARLKVAAGTHRVKVFFPQAKQSRTRTVRIRADETQGVVVVLGD